MKLPLAVFFVIMLSISHLATAQSLAPSTARQIFSLEKGDILEYRKWTIANGCGTICDWYELKTVDSIRYNQPADTLFIHFETELVRFDSGAAPSQCGVCQQQFLFADACPIYSDEWDITYLDSSVVYYIDSAEDSRFSGEKDSSFVNNLNYNGSKQNWYRLSKDNGLARSTTEEIYVDSVGIVFKIVYFENQNTNIEQLIYYHKTNGKTWGSAFFGVGINNLIAAETISVYPNPSNNKFIITDETFENRHFKLYDALARPVIDVNLMNKQTEIQRNNLSSGIYFWQICAEDDIIRTGKLVFN